MSANLESLGFLSPAQGPDELGRLGPYRVLKVLGQGGMGVVFQAEDPQLQRTVALKAMLPEVAKRPLARQRFLQEARAVAKIEHDHIVTVFQVGEDRGVPYLAMQLLKGTSLDEFLKKKAKSAKPMSLEQILKLGREAAKGLGAAHEKGLIHRDVKPANIWLDASAGGRVKILDFGLARGAEDNAERLTQLGQIVGTVTYMAPEQARSDRIDARADLFSLGCVLYRLCTGRLPWKGEDATATMIMIATEEPPPVKTLNPEVPQKLAELIHKLLAKKPEDRPASAKAVVAAIQAIEEAQPAATKVMSVELVPAAVATAVPSAHAADFDRTEAEAMAFPRAARRSRPRQSPVLLLGGLAAVAVVVLAVVGVVVFLVLKQAPATPVAGASDSLPSSGKKPDVAGPKEPPRPVESAQQKKDAWMRQVASLPPEKQLAEVGRKLKEVNPDFDGNVERVAGVNGIAFVSDHVTDVWPVRALAKVVFVKCDGSAPGMGKLEDLSPLKGLLLDGLSCNMTRVADLTPLDTMPLKKISLYNTRVRDLKPLKGMPIDYLDCGNTKVGDLEPLRGNKHLTHLSCANTPVAKVAALQGLPLTVLRLDGTSVTDLSPLKRMPLTFLRVDGTSVTDLSPLMRMPLTFLRVDGTSATDLSPLKDMPLQQLFCTLNKPDDLKVIQSLGKLQTINGIKIDEFWKQLQAQKKP